MVNHRFFFIAIVFLIFSSPSSLGSYDAKAEKHPTNFKLSQLNLLDKEPKEQKIEKIAQLNTIEPENKIDKNLSLWGIGGTFILFLYMSFILFQPETNPALEKENISLKVFDDLDPNLDLVDRSAISKNVETVKVQEKVKTIEIPLIVKQSNLEINFESIVNQIPKEIKQSDRINSDLIMNPKNIQGLTLESKTTVKSDAIGKLNIVTEKITEIDVVSELIKDLQIDQNQVNTINRQKEVRRKAIWELGQTNDFRAVEPLVSMISEVNSLEKNLILDAITNITTHSLETIHQVLLKSLEDRNAKVRKNAIENLANLYQSMSLITFRLSQMTLDSDIEVQQTAKLALKKFKEMPVSLSAVDLN